MDSVLALHPAAPASILGVPKKFCLGVAEIYGTSLLRQWRSLKVDRTHLVLLDSTTKNQLERHSSFLPISVK